LDILGRVSNILASSGDIYFLVLVDYGILEIKDRKRIFVKIVGKNGVSVPVFGYITGKGKEQTFIEDPGILTEIENRLRDVSVGPAKNLITEDNPIIDRFYCEVNECLRVINFTRPIFKELSDIVYKDGIVKGINSSYAKLSVEEVGILYKYFESYFASVYLNLFNTKIKRLFSRTIQNHYLRFFSNLKSFVPFLFTGPCVINPLLDAGRFNKVFSQTALYKKAMESRYGVKDSHLYVITNREICECLGLTRYAPFTGIQLVFIVLGLSNPQFFPSKERYAYLVPESGRVFSSPQEVVSSGFSLDSARRLSTLHILCQTYSKSLGIYSDRDFNKYMDIVDNVQLL